MVAVHVDTKTVKTFTLTLSSEEAVLLAELFYRVGGPPEGPRGLIGAMAGALEAAGVKPDVDTNRSMGSIHFREDFKVIQPEEGMI